MPNYSPGYSYTCVTGSRVRFNTRVGSHYYSCLQQVLTINGARVLDDAVPTALTGPDDGFSSVVDDDPVQQQRKDMVLSSVNDGSGGGSAGNQRIVAIGHAVDRVLFPLPVGDVLATMRADRQRRYSVFLRTVDEYCSSSVRNLLSGTSIHPSPWFSFLCDSVGTGRKIKGPLSSYFLDPTPNFEGTE